MKSRSVLRLFVFGLSFGFFYLAQLSISSETGSHQEKISYKMVRKSGTPYGPERMKKLSNPVPFFVGVDRIDQRHSGYLNPKSE